MLLNVSNSDISNYQIETIIISNAYIFVYHLGTVLCCVDLVVTET